MKNKALPISIILLIVFVLVLSLCACTINAPVVITFVTNGADYEVDPIEVEDGVEQITLPTLTREGYTFNGWYYDMAFKKGCGTSLLGDDIPTKSIKLYAKWTKDVYIVTFMAGTNELKRQNCSYGDRIQYADYPVIPSTSEYEGYYWSYQTYTITANLTISASYSSGGGGEDPTDNTHTVTYYSLNNQNTYVKYKEYSGEAGTVIDVPNTPSAPIDGNTYCFIGWYYDMAGDNKCINPPTAIGEENVSIYANFLVYSDDSLYLRYTVDSATNEATITGLTESGLYKTTIFIPESINGYRVTAIGYDYSSFDTLIDLNVFKTSVLKNIIIPSSISFIGNWAFYNCSSLQSVIFLGNNFTSIGEGCFAGCSSLSSIEIPDNVTTIGKLAFAGVVSVYDFEDYVETTKTIDSLPYEKFTDAEMSLQNVIITSSSKLSTIGDDAFYNCYDLKTIKLSASMSSLNAKAFSNSGIEAVNFYEDGRLTSKDGVVYSASQAILYYYPLNGNASFVIPDSVTRIATGAFYDNKKIENIVFDANLATIGESAFENCENLTSIDLSNTSIATIGNNAFKNCGNVISISTSETLSSLGESVFKDCSSATTIDLNGTMTEIPSNAFSGCTSLTRMEIPGGVVTISDYAFYNNNKLSVLLFDANNTLKTIGDYAFEECLSLPDVELPTSIESIGQYAFAGISSKSTFSVSSNVKLENVKHYGDYCFSNTSMITFTIYGAIEDNDSLGDYMFKDCTSLTNCTFTTTNNYDTIAEGLFYGCTSLQRCSIRENVLHIADYAFYGCTGITTITFNDSLKTIGDYSFYNCSSLNDNESKVLPTGVESVGEYSFYNCSKIKTVYLTEYMTIVPSYAFANCTSVTTISYYSDSLILTTIDENAFMNCTSLVVATLPSSLALKNDTDTAGLIKNPFLGCTNLREYAFNATNINDLYISDGVVYHQLYDSSSNPLDSELEIYAYPTGKSTTNHTIYNNVAAISRYAYYGATITGLTIDIPLKDAETQVTSIMMLDIGDYAFAECDSMQFASISFRVGRIGDHAFYNCDVLRDITIADTEEVEFGVTPLFTLLNKATNYAYDTNRVEISSYAFSELPITTMVLPSTLSELGEGALSNCYQLANVTISPTSTNITLGDYAFAYDTALSTIDIPKSVSVLGNHCFYMCSNITSVTLASDSEELDIGDYAFAEMHYLTSITLPANVVNIGNYAFYADSRMQTVTFGSSSDRTLVTGLSIGEYAFYRVSNLYSITIPNYVVLIDDYCFYKTKLEEILFLSNSSDDDLVIGDYVFAESSRLKSIVLPDNLVELGEGAFYDSELETYEYNSTSRYLVIGDSAFSKTKMTTITFKRNILSIGDNVLYGSTLLTEVIIDPDGIIIIPNYAFYNCTALTNITISSYVLGIGEYAFANTAVTNLDVNVSGIGSFAFTQSSLESITITSNGNFDRIIDSSAFYMANSLRSVIIDVPNCDLYIKFMAFASCSKLEELRLICKNLILQDGFALSCTSLYEGFEVTETNSSKNYYFDSTEHVLYTSDYGGADTTFVFYPAGKTGAIFELDSSVSKIRNYAFSGNHYLMGLILQYDGVVNLISELGPNTGNSAFLEMDSQFTIYVGTDYVTTSINTWGISKVAAYEVYGDGFTLQVQNSNKYYIVSYIGAETDVVVPASINVGGKIYVITGIGTSAFMNNTSITSVTIESGVKSIENNAFRNCTSLTTVSIPDTVTNIKSAAFYGCTSLTSIVFAADSMITNIGDYAFYNCINLNNVILPEGVETIGNFSFYNNINITNLNLGESLESIGNYAFANLKSIESIVIPSTVKNMGTNVLNGTEDLVYIDFRCDSVPTITRNTFNGINASAFLFVGTQLKKSYELDSIWRLYLDKLIAVDNICSVAGYEKYVIEKINGNNYKLIGYIGTSSDTDITIRSQISDNIFITTIGEYAFGQFVENVVLDEGIVTIGSRAFTYATSLQSITIPTTVTTIGIYAFSGITSLQTVTFATTIINGDEEDSNLRSIADYAFYGCTNLSSIEFSDSLVSIGKYAFSGSSTSPMSLSTVTFKHNATTTSHNVCIDSIGSYAFAYNDGLHSLVFNCKVNEIKNGAFFSCTALDFIEFNYVGTSGSSSSDVVTVLEAYNGNVFKNDYKLSIVLPDPRMVQRYKDIWLSTAIERYLLTAKSYVVNDPIYGDFVYAIVNSTNRTVTVTNYLGSETEVVFPSSVAINGYTYTVVRIGRETNNNTTVMNGFVIGSNVTKITIPYTVTTIGEDAFSYSESLRTVIVDDKVVNGSIYTSKLETIEQKAFAGCANLETVLLPNSLKTLQSSVFMDCTSLNYYNDLTTKGIKIVEYIEPINDGILSIGSYCFAGCTSLTNYYIANQVKNIGDYVFQNCTSLSTITFSSYPLITSIGRYSFANTVIEEITIPESVTNVGNYAFYNDKSLRSVYLMREKTENNQSITTTERNVFSGVNNPHLRVFVSTKDYSSYHTSVGWSTATVIENQITSDGLYAYAVLPNAAESIIIKAYLGTDAEITIPYSLTIEGASYYVRQIGAYFGTQTLEKVKFAANSRITAIDDYAFAECHALKEIILPADLTTIGKYGFYNCTKLERVELPNKLETISDYLFSGCSSLREIIVPESVETLGNASFANCINLARVTIKFTTASILGTDAFSGSATEVNGNLKVVVPYTDLGKFLSSWNLIESYIVSDAFLFGDFIVGYNEDETGWVLLQYTGDADTLDLTTFTLQGLYIKEIVEHAVISDVTTFIVKTDVIYYDDLAGRVTIID